MKRIILCVALVVALRANAIIDPRGKCNWGNPSNATTDANNHAHYLIQRPIEAMDYNDSHGQPNWASWDLIPGGKGVQGPVKN